MKSGMKRLLSIALLCILMLSLVTTAYAVTPRASDYFAATGCAVYAKGSGKILIETDINATEKMDKLGLEAVYVYERQYDGTYNEVAVYTPEDTAGMMFVDTAFYEGDIYYQGMIGKEYYALVAFYAENAAGSEAIYRATDAVIAY